MLNPELLIFAKYVLCIGIIVVVWMFPAWLAAQTKKDKHVMGMVRCSSWLFGWTGIGWIYALYLAVR